MRLEVFLMILTLTFAGGTICNAATFHGGRAGSCDGCHGVNSSENNYTTLLGADPGSTCLRCHASAAPIDYQIATHPAPPQGTAPKSLTPGGDFAYLLKTYTWTNANGTKGTSHGDRHGHNIVAQAYGYTRDRTLTASPGGSYPAAALSCISCHDPHGNYRLLDVYGTIATDVNPIEGSGSYGAVPTADAAVGSYRLLAGKGYQTKAVGHTFANDPPIAVSPQAYNRSEAGTDTRVAYGKGVSKWCGNCHGAFLQGGHLHPADAELGSLAGNYNNYVKSGDLGGSQADSYSSLVPFQSAEMTDPQQLAMEVTSTAGPNPNDRIICLSCHRAHASGWDSMARWNMKGTFLTVAGEYPGIDGFGKGGEGANSTGKLATEYKAGMYKRDPSKFATFQRQLCNKCHARD